jgi:multicomponent Na+:H+ antiporter subunit F
MFFLMRSLVANAATIMADKMIDVVCHIVMLMLIVSFGAAFVRVVIGPSLPDRVVALDIAATIVVALILTHCVQTGSAYYIPAAISIALLSFVGTVALALYIRKGGAS